MSTFTGVPDAGATKETKSRVRKAMFGDGYEQRTPDGLNNLYEVWPLNFTVRTKAEILAYDTFLRDLNGATSFDWVTPEGLTKKFKCESWSASYYNDFNATMSALFEQVYEP